MTCKVDQNYCENSDRCQVRPGTLAENGGWVAGQRLRGTWAPHVSQTFIVRGARRMTWAGMSWPPHSQVPTA
jgi:hypothetical protein